MTDYQHPFHPFGLHSIGTNYPTKTIEQEENSTIRNVSLIAKGFCVNKENRIGDTFETISGPYIHVMNEQKIYLVTPNATSESTEITRKEKDFIEYSFVCNHKKHGLSEGTARFEIIILNPSMDFAPTFIFKSTYENNQNRKGVIYFDKYFYPEGSAYNDYPLSFSDLLNVTQCR